VLTGPADNPAAEAATAFVRDAESGVDNTLFIECVKPAAAEAGVLSVPAWAVSNWD
jgi:hypothetical protein